MCSMGALTGAPIGTIPFPKLLVSPVEARTISVEAPNSNRDP